MYVVSIETMRCCDECTDTNLCLGASTIVRAAVTENDLTPSDQPGLRLQHGCGISSHE